MALIKIIANGIELDFVRETLTIKKENNALIKDFKASYSSFPFLIVENQNTKLALGSRDIVSVNKPKTIQVKVLENNIENYGELQILNYIDGFRKCNLKYGSVLLSIMSRKIAEFMPVVSVVDESDAGSPGSITPYVEESDAVIPGYTYWPSYVALLRDKCFPDAFWQFPLMNHLNKFGINLESTDDWYPYKNKVNDIDAAADFIINTIEDLGVDGFNIINRNVAAPQIFLLSPLFFMLESIGFKMEGDFTSNELIKRLLFLSSKDNLTKVNLSNEAVDVDLDTPSFVETLDIWHAHPPTNTFRKIQIVPVTVPGEYIVTFRFELRGPHSLYHAAISLYVNPPGSDNSLFLFFKSSAGNHEIVEGSYIIDVAGAGNIEFWYFNKYEQMPYTYSLSVVRKEVNSFYEMNPTIETGRFLPEWTGATYLNELKTLFNLNIEIDELRKRVSLTFNQDWILNSVAEVLKKSLAITTYEQSPYTAFHLKFENDVDSSLWITNTGAVPYVNQSSDFSQDIQSKFKFIPVTNTANLSEELDSKDGVGLMIYDESRFPLISKDYNGIDLTIDSIYNNFYKIWLHFRLNASLIEFIGYFTEIEISKIMNSKRIYLDNQEYVISSVDAKELKNDNYQVKIKVESINF